MKNKFYITTSIAYTNAPPHIGYALELVQADVLARWNYQLGKETLLLTGTDDHGIKIEEAARAQGRDPAEFVRELSEQFRNLADKLDIGDKKNWLRDFIRTDDRPRHGPGVEKMWNKLLEAGKLYKGQYKGLYCIGHEGYIKESELENGLCPIHKTKPEYFEEENWFFKLTDYKNELQKLYEGGVIKILPESKKSEILNMLKNLEDISFSRPASKLTWGFAVPNDVTQTMYVWVDALTNYISALGYGHEDESLFKKFWPADVHLIGKDILKFHALYWPAMLMAADEKLPKAINIHGFVTVEGEKMSKSLGNVIDPIKLIDRYGVDVVRYFLLREIASDNDGDFSERKLIERYNGELANGLGNLVSRVMKMAVTYEVKLEPKDFLSFEDLLKDDFGRGFARSIEEFKLNKALDLLWSISEDNPQTLITYGLTNYNFSGINSTSSVAGINLEIQKDSPFKEKNPEIRREKIYKELSKIQKVATLLTIFMPQTSLKILDLLKNNQMPVQPLFPRIP